jgi:hypothetical protein
MGFIGGAEAVRNFSVAGENTQLPANGCDGPVFSKAVKCEDWAVLYERAETAGAAI